MQLNLIGLHVKLGTYCFSIHWPVTKINASVYPKTSPVLVGAITAVSTWMNIKFDVRLKLEIELVIDGHDSDDSRKRERGT